MRNLNKMNITINIYIGSDGKISISSFNSEESKPVEIQPMTQQTESPFRFVNPDYIETLDKFHSAHLPKMAYRILRYICESAGNCADIEDLCESLKIDKESVRNACSNKLSTIFRQGGFPYKVKQRNGFVFLEKTQEQQQTD